VTPGDLRGVVALDGPSGTGKSTVARRLATALGARYLDTGAMYRAVTLAVLRHGADPADADAVLGVSASAVIEIGTDPAAPAVRLDGADVAADIRGADVTAAVSAIASIQGVRARLIAEQRLIIADGSGIVVEGRDIGDVVAPEAELKVFLTASAEARARRRTRQDRSAGRSATVDQTRVAVDRRDGLDNRTTPLRPVTGAVELDTTELDVNGVIAELLALVDSRRMRGVPDPTAGH
jgi:cytidylate kinase